VSQFAKEASAEPYLSWRLDDVPMSASVMARLRPALGAERTTIDDIVALVSSDPIASSRIICWLQLADQSKAVSDVRHAISMLGLAKVKQLFAELSVAEERDQVLMQLLACEVKVSESAAVIASALAEKKGHLSASQAASAAMMYGLPVWLVSQNEPQRYAQWWLTGHWGRNAKYWARSIAGKQRERAWSWFGLPDLVRESLELGIKLDRRALVTIANGVNKNTGNICQRIDSSELNFIAHSQTFTIYLANQLARDLITLGGGGVHSLWWRLAAYHLNQPVMRVTKLLTQKLRHYQPPREGGFPLAQALLWSAPDKPVLPINEATLLRLARPANSSADLDLQSQMKTNNANVSVRKNSKAPVAIQPQYLKKLLQSKEAGISTGQFFQLCLMTATDGLTIRRGFIALANGARQHLSLRYQVGFGTPGLPESLLNGFDGSLFNKLMQVPKGLLVDKTQRAKLAALLPDAVFRKLGEHDFIAIPIYLGNKPICLLYVDNAHQPAVNAAHLVELSKLAKIATKILPIILQKQKQRKS